MIVGTKLYCFDVSSLRPLVKEEEGAVCVCGENLRENVLCVGVCMKMCDGMWNAIM
jgi:hypothetical protein